MLLDAAAFVLTLLLVVLMGGWPRTPAASTPGRTRAAALRQVVAQLGTRQACRGSGAALQRLRDGVTSFSAAP
jgi:hypothetical protein